MVVQQMELGTPPQTMSRSVRSSKRTMRGSRDKAPRWLTLAEQHKNSFNPSNGSDGDSSLDQRGLETLERSTTPCVALGDSGVEADHVGHKALPELLRCNVIYEGQA